MESPVARSSQCVRILSVASVQVRAILRSHPFRLFTPLAALFILLSPHLVFFAFDHEAATFTQLGISTSALFAILLGLLAGAGGLAPERESGIRDFILATSLSPGTYVVGKWVGIAFVVFLSTGVLGTVHLLGLYLWWGGPSTLTPVLGALGAAAVHGALAAAVALLFSALMSEGSAVVAAILFLLAGHAVHILEASALTEVLRFLLPRLPYLTLDLEAAFGPFGVRMWLFALLHGLLYSAFLLALIAPLAGRPAGGKT